MASDGRAAVFGLLGALVGGAASFGGTYLNVHLTQKNERLDSERAAYVDFASKTDQYATDLIDVGQVLQARPLRAEEYGKLRDRLRAEIAPVNTAYQALSILGTANVAQKAAALQQDLFGVFLPFEPRQANLKLLNTLLQKYYGLFAQYTDAARAQVAAEGG